jgi:hypothetical protein
MIFSFVPPLMADFFCADVASATRAEEGEEDGCVEVSGI